MKMILGLFFPLSAVSTAMGSPVKPKLIDFVG